MDPDSASAETEGPETASEDAGPSAAADWQREYEWVLAHPGDYPVNSAAQYKPDGTYQYALVEATGGGRLAVWASASGNGVYQISGSSMGKELTSQRFTLDGTSLRGGEKESFPSGGQLPDHQLIDWTPVSNTQLLYDGNFAALPSAGENVSRGDTSAAASENQIEFVGNVVRKTGEELMAPRGLGMPNGQDPQSEYFLLWLDEPMTVTGSVGGGTDTKEIQYVALGSRELWPRGPEEINTEWEDRVGERVKILKNKEDIGFPSDTSMPLGALWISTDDTVEVLN